MENLGSIFKLIRNLYLNLNLPALSGPQTEKLGLISCHLLCCSSCYLLFCSLSSCFRLSCLLVSRQWLVITFHLSWYSSPELHSLSPYTQHVVKICLLLAENTLQACCQHRTASPYVIGHIIPAAGEKAACCLGCGT